MQIGIYILISERTYFNYLFLGNSHPKTVSETKFVHEKRQIAQAGSCAGKISYEGVASYNVGERSIK